MTTPLPGVGRPETRYAAGNRGHIAYQRFGSGEPDIVFATSALSNVDTIWDEPTAARFLDRLAEMGTVIQYDMRGSGVSDPVAGRSIWQTVEEVVDDIIAVLDDAGVERVVAFGDCEGGLFATMLAASFPERVSMLVLVNAFACIVRHDDYPIGLPQEAAAALSDQYAAQHGRTGDMLDLTAPSVASDERFRSWWVRQQRLSVPPALARSTFEWLGQVDVRAALPLVSVPTLVVGRRDARYHRAAFSEYLAGHIGGAELRILPGADTAPFNAGDFDPVLDEVEAFVTGGPTARISDRVLATVVFTDIVGSTALAAEVGDERWSDLLVRHDRIAKRLIERFRGVFVDAAGDGTLATFDGPARAVTFASALARELRGIGLTIRAGIHTGEVVRSGAEISGLAVHIAARVMASAEGGGVVVSRTVTDLVVGSGLEFDRIGAVELSGVPGEWELHRLVSDR